MSPIQFTDVLGGVSSSGAKAARLEDAVLLQELAWKTWLRGVMCGKVVRTTTSDSQTPCPLDRVNRQFKADRPNQLCRQPAGFVTLNGAHLKVGPYFAGLGLPNAKVNTQSELGNCRFLGLPDGLTAVVRADSSQRAVVGLPSVAATAALPQFIASS